MDMRLIHTRFYKNPTKDGKLYILFTKSSHITQKILNQENNIDVSFEERKVYYCAQCQHIIAPNMLVMLAGERRIQQRNDYTVFIIDCG